MSELIIGNEYQYKAPHPNIKEWRCGKLIAFNERDVVLQKDDGTFKVIQRKCILIRPKVKGHTVNFWVNVYPYGFVNRIYQSREDADAGAVSNRTSCLHFTCTFVEGEGLLPVPTDKDYLTVVNGEWRPIETAPKDGTRILVTDGYSCSVVSWCNYWAIGIFGEYGDSDNEFYDATHWMSLPEPPAREE